jgi:hypothetical protein
MAAVPAAALAVPAVPAGTAGAPAVGEVTGIDGATGGWPVGAPAAGAAGVPAAGAAGATGAGITVPPMPATGATLVTPGSGKQAAAKTLTPPITIHALIVIMVYNTRLHSNFENT